MEYNGSAIVAMSGKNCVGIASDRRFGVQAQTLATDAQKVFQMGEKTMIGLTGLNSDVLTFSQQLSMRIKMYRLQHEKEISPQAFGKLVSTLLYERRFGPFFVEPVVAGLDENNKPYLTGTDLIGAPVYTDDFVLAGTATEQLFGTCESLYKPDMEPEQLFEVLSQCLLSAVDRDCVSGWGGSVYIITPDRVISRTLRGRMD